MKCRFCGAGSTHPFLDLGSAPPSNAYLTPAALDAPELWYPLRVRVCGQCWLVQTQDHARREALFSDDYAYFSSYSSSWLDHSQKYIQTMQRRFALDASSMVVEVASNDGYLLQYVQKAGVPCYGIEPTAGTAAAAKAKGIAVVEKFFGIELAHELAGQGRQADLMVANNVLAHVPDINDFVGGFALLLKAQGVATFEFPHLLRMVQQNQFDTAYHEHYSYLSLLAVQRICAAHGLAVFDVQELPTHGGSLRVFVQLAHGGRHPSGPGLQRVAQQEQAAGMAAGPFYAGFQAQAERIKRELLTWLLQCARDGVRVGAYGAAAKGNTMLNFAGVRPDLLPYVVDRNPAKQGRYLPGSRIPIVDKEHLLADRPDRVLILPWNLRDEVMAQLAGIREWDGRFVTAVPQLEELP